MTLSGAAANSAPAKKPFGGMIPARVRPAALTIGGFGALLVVIEVINFATRPWLVDTLGIRPRSAHGLIGIVTAPLLHAGWGHLFSNLVPFLIFGFLVLVGGAQQFVAVTTVVWLVSGFGVWLIAASNSVTVGASGVVFGWLAYLVSRGFFNRRVGQIAVGLILLAIWGGLFWGLFPGATGVSWQAHLFGAVGGVLAAMLVYRADSPAKKSVPQA